MPKQRPTTIDEYLAGLTDDQRVALERLRRTIRAAAPKAQECISYGVPAFRLGGMLAGFGASAKHCSYYPMSGTVLTRLKGELDGYDVGKGTIRFLPDKPLPAALVRKLVKTRIAEMAGDGAEGTKKRASTGSIGATQAGTGKTKVRTGNAKAGSGKAKAGTRSAGSKWQCESRKRQGESRYPQRESWKRQFKTRNRPGEG